MLTKNDEGYSIEVSCEKVGCSRAMFYKRRCIAELDEVDHDLFERLRERALADGSTLQAFNKICKQKMAESPLKHMVKDMKKDGKLLP